MSETQPVNRSETESRKKIGLQRALEYLSSATLSDLGNYTCNAAVNLYEIGRLDLAAALLELTIDFEMDKFIKISAEREAFEKESGDWSHNKFAFRFYVNTSGDLEIRTEYKEMMEDIIRIAAAEKISTGKNSMALNLLQKYKLMTPEQFKDKYGEPDVAKENESFRLRDSDRSINDEEYLLFLALRKKYENHKFMDEAQKSEIIESVKSKIKEALAS